MSVKLVIMVGIVALVAGLLYAQATGEGDNLSLKQANLYECVIGVGNQLFAAPHVISTNCLRKGTCTPLLYFSAGKPLSLFSNQGTLVYETSDFNGQQTYDVGEGSSASYSAKVCTHDQNLHILLKDEDGNIIDERKENLPGWG